MESKPKFINADDLVAELRDDLAQDCNHYMYWYQKEERDSKYIFAIDRIEEAPTVDAVEVVHGRWVWDVETHGDPMYGVDEDFGYRCSECQVWADEYGVDGDIYDEPPTHILHYCPNCGAKMDGEQNG